MDHVSKPINYESPRFLTCPHAPRELRAGWLSTVPIFHAFVFIPSVCPVSVFGTFGAFQSSLGFEPPSGGLTLSVVPLCYCAISVCLERGAWGGGG